MENNKIIKKVFIHRDKLLKGNKKSYIVDMGNNRYCYIPKAHIYEIDNLMNVLKVVIIIDNDYQITNLNEYHSIDGGIKWCGVDILNALYDDNKKHNMDFHNINKKIGANNV